MNTRNPCKRCPIEEYLYLCTMLSKLKQCGLSYETSLMLIRTRAKDPAPLANTLVRCELRDKVPPLPPGYTLDR